VAAVLFSQDPNGMRVSVAIEIVGGSWPVSPALPDHRSIDHAGPLAPFIAQLAAAYLQAPPAWALERRAHAKATAGYATSLPGGGAKFDRSV
jgi:hypothetical protein